MRSLLQLLRSPEFLGLLAIWLVTHILSTLYFETWLWLLLGIVPTTLIAILSFIAFRLRWPHK